VRTIVERLVKRLRKEDGGFALPFIASVLVLLLLMSAFAIDLGWFFLNGSRIQRAADSSALAGVVFLPSDVGNVTAKSVDGANANGYDIGTVNGAPVVGGGPDDLAWRQLADNKLEVSLTSTVSTFFLKVIGFDQLTMTRTATAQYVKPVPLGAPANCIGIGQTVTSTGLPNGNGNAAYQKCNEFTQNFWSAINGRLTAKEHGDPYAPSCNYQCTGGTNPNFDPNYYFAVEVPPGATNVDVFLYDAGFYDRDSFAEAGDEGNLSNSTAGGTNMTFSLFQPDVTPLIPEDNSASVSCSQGNNTLTINSESNPGTYRNQWARLCNISNVVEGIYVLRVSSSGGSIGGSNSFSILVDSNNLATNVPRVYSLNEMSIFTNDDDGSATVYIAEVDPVHANKTLELTFYDPGEGAGNATMSVVPPPGVGSISCSWTATDVRPGGGPNSGNSCTINSTVSGTAQYDGEWITMRIGIPAGYNCTTDCFWKMNLNLNVSHDRTTWEARVIGNPVSLVPNE
jgi:Flp pilus assembly protein TadG